MTKRRHNLSAESTIDQTVLNSWTKCPGLVIEDELSQFFNNKSKQPNNGGRQTKGDNTATSSAAEVTVIDEDV